MQVLNSSHLPPQATCFQLVWFFISFAFIPSSRHFRLLKRVIDTVKNYRTIITIKISGQCAAGVARTQTTDKFENNTRQ